MLNPPPKFETDRLILKPFILKDANSIFDVYAKHDESTKYISWPTHQSIDESLDFVRSTILDSKNSEYTYGVFRKFDDQLLGSTVFKHTVGRVEVGYIVGPEYCGFGYATEALGVMVNWIVKEHRIFRLWANCDTENIASQRVLEKTGFLKEALITDWAIFPNQNQKVKDCIFFNYPLLRQRS